MPTRMVAWFIALLGGIGLTNHTLAAQPSQSVHRDSGQVSIGLRIVPAFSISPLKTRDGPTTGGPYLFCLSGPSRSPYSLQLQRSDQDQHWYAARSPTTETTTEQWCQQGQPVSLTEQQEPLPEQGTLVLMVRAE